MKALVSVLLLAVGPLYAQDPLPSWNDTAPKKAIVDFVEKVTKEGLPDFVPPSERIATFEMMERSGPSSRFIFNLPSRLTG